jgi:hypothetical protein
VLGDDEFAARSKTQSARPRGWGEQGVPSRQASLIVEPADGRFPPLTPEGQRRFEPAKSTYYLDFPDAVVHHPFPNFADLGPYEFQLRAYALAAWRRFPGRLQHGQRDFPDSGHVIRNEMIHETRASRSTADRTSAREFVSTWETREAIGKATRSSSKRQLQRRSG